MEYIMTLDHDTDIAYFYTDDLDTVYFNLPTIARRTGYKTKAKLINEFFLREIICIKAECYPTEDRDMCDECPIERIIHRVL